MNTVAYVLVILATLILRGAARGRNIAQLPQDIGDFFTAVISIRMERKSDGGVELDTSDVREVLARTGDVPAGNGDASPSANVSTAGLPAATAALAWARTKIGLPYEYASNGPNSYDCSGLTSQAYKSVGITIPRNTVGQILVGKAVAKGDLRPGDLVFPNPGHVQIYAGNGRVVEAPKPGSKVREVPMWGFLTARRVVS